MPFIKSVLILFLLLPMQGFSEQVIQSPLKSSESARGTLVMNSVTSSEGADSFALQVHLSIKDDPREGKESYSERRRKFELDPVSIYDFVKVRPAVKFTINSTESGLVLSGSFKPETEYAITLLKGLKIKTGQEIPADSEQEIKTGSFRPHIRFSSKARYMPGALAGNLTFESVNVKAIDISIRQVYPQNLHQWLTSGEYANQFVSEEIKNKTIKVKSKRNGIYKGTISLEEFNPLGNGIYVVTATAKKPAVVAAAPAENTEGEGEEAGEDGGNNANASDSTSVVVSNLSAVVKWGAKNTLKAWLLKTNDLSPVSGVNVELYSESNRKLDTCTTEGASGECALKWKDSKAVPFAVVFRSKEDATYIKLSDLAIKNDRFHAGTRDYVSDQQGFDAFVYSGRDLYRPGEEVDLAVQVRNKKFEAVSKLPLTWKISNPKGKIIREGTTQTDDFGVSHLPFQTQISFDTGKYLAQVWSGNQELHAVSFLVEEFVPERIGLKVKPAQEEFINKASAAFSLEALYLFGPPVVEGEFKASCSLVPAFKKIPKNSDYSTGFYMDEMNKVISLDVVSGKTDAKGLAQFNCDYQNQIGKKSPIVYELRAKTDVEEAGSSRVTSKVATAFVGSTDALIGLRMLDKKSSEIKVDGGFFDFKGAPVKRQASLKARLYRIDQHWNYSYDNGGGYNNWKVEELVVPTGIEKEITVNDSKFEIIFTPPESWGQWLVRVEDAKTGYTADLNTGYLGWYYDSSGTGPAVREPEDLKMEISKKQVSPGDNFKVLFQAPFAGRLLVSLESNTVVESKWVHVAKPGTVEVEFKAPNVLPNFYVTGLLIKNPMEGKRFLPARAFSSQNVEVVPVEHRMQVLVKAPEVMESRKELTISISNDQKLPVEYTVAVVDEGILQMTNFKSPNPLARFFEARRLGVTSSETIGWTMSGTAKGKGTPGGDEGKNKGTQNFPVRLLSFFNPHVFSDASGHAEVKFLIPEFQGKVRVMVVASHKTRMGSADLPVIVRDPIVIQSTLPRFLTQEDRFQFPVALTNTSGKEQKVTVSVETADAVKLSNPTQSVTLNNNQMKALKFPVEVVAVNGTADIRIVAKSADGKLASTESFSLNVRPRGVEQTLHLTYQAGDAGQIEAPLEKVVPKDWRRENIKITATLSNLPFLGQISHMDYLLHYPYGCIEQTTSTTLPLLAMEDLMKFVDVSSKKSPPVKNMVNRGIARVMSMQTGSGGFSYWPGDSEANPWGTAYATFMLLEAKKMGYEVSKDAIDSALDYMLNYVRAKPYSLTKSSYETVSDPWMLFVLAKGGKQVTAELRKTLDKYAPKMSSSQFDDQAGENLFLLAATAKALGDKESLEKLMPDEQLLSAQLHGKRDDYYTYWSSLRSDGMRLAIIQDLWPASSAIQILSQRIATNLDRVGGYYSTQEVAWGVLALGKQARSLEKLSSEELKKLTLLANGNPVPNGYDVQGMPTWSMEGALSKAVLTVKNTTAKSGTFLYLNVAGVTKETPKGKGTFAISRRYLNREGSTIDPQKIKQGDVLTVNLTFRSSNGVSYRNAAIVDRIPAGFEIENARLGRGEEVSWISKDSVFVPEYQDIRDDRIQLFGTVKDEKEFYYSVRAVTSGKFVAPPPLIEQMYDPEAFDYGSSTIVEILDK